jgi:glutamyl-tRNA synthetase
VLALEQERLKTLGEAAERVSFFFLDELTYDTSLLIQKQMDAPRTREVLLQAREVLTGLDRWEASVLEPSIRALIPKMGLKAGQALGSLRAAVSGSPATPPLFQMMEVLGREVCLKRLNEAIARLS